jgi:hypothetical protein
MAWRGIADPPNIEIEAIAGGERDGTSDPLARSREAGISGDR